VKPPARVAEARRAAPAAAAAAVAWRTSAVMAARKEARAARVHAAEYHTCDSREGVCVWHDIRCGQ
jgi:hypothetical protein